MKYSKCKFLPIVISVIGLFLCSNIKSQIVPETIKVENAGTLSTLISSTKKDSITDLNLSGYLNGTDLRYIREMYALTKLNMTDANIVKGGYFSVNGKDYSVIDNTISDYMFCEMPYLISVTIPNRTTAIGSRSFKNCTGLTSIIIPNRVTSINESAFEGCTGLTAVTISEKVTSIGPSAFKGCTGLAAVIIPNSVTSIGASAFENCIGLTSIAIPDNVTSIGFSVFEGCTGLKSVIISSKIKIVSSRAFLGCTGLKSVNIPNNIIEIGGFAFYECKGLTTVSIGSSVTSIGREAFHACSGLKSVNIPNSTITIESSAFDGCSGLSSITLGNSVGSMADLVFWGCTGLKEVHSNNPTPPLITNITFYQVDKLSCSIYVPKNSYSAYKVAVGWSDFKNIIEEEVATSISEIEMNKIQVYTESNTIVVKRANLGGTVSVYTLLGTLLQKIKVTDDEIRIVVPANNIYLVRVDNKIIKVIL